MAIADDFNVDASGNIRQDVAFVPGTHTRYTTLDLHAWLQDMADDATSTPDDYVDILDANPSELAGKRNAVRPMALTLLNSFNIDDATAQWFKFGSVEQNSGATMYTGLKVIGSMVANSPIYIVKSDNTKMTKYWEDADATDFQILVKSMASSSYLGDITVFSRKYGQTYSHWDVDLSPGGEQPAALSTAVDGNVDTGVMDATTCAGYFSSAIGGTATPGTQKITLAYGAVSGDLGTGAHDYKGTITLDGSVSVSQAYQALMWACSESSNITFNSIPGWRYRKLDAAYPENIAAPLGTFAGGKWFVAQGWFLAGYLSGDSLKFQLIDDAGATVTAPNAITISVTGVVAGDYVLVGRDNGSGDINTAEYTVSGSSGAGTVTVTGLASDTPETGVIRIDGDRYEYTGWTGTTVTLSGTLSTNYSSVSAFIPFIDQVVASGTSVTSANMQYGSDFTAVFRVRNGGGSPIVPFQSSIAVTATGGSGTAVRTADA